jgi:hypothetical protein
MIAVQAKGLFFNHLTTTSFAVTVDDPTARQVIGRHFHTHMIA